MRIVFYCLLGAALLGCNAVTGGYDNGRYADASDSTDHDAGTSTNSNATDGENTTSSSSGTDTAPIEGSDTEIGRAHV